MNCDEEGNIMGSGFIVRAAPNGGRCFGKLALLNVAQCNFTKTLGAAARTDAPENIVGSKAEPLCRL